jgi:hypothetical protein
LLEGFGVPAEGTHVLLFHGSDLSCVPEGPDGQAKRVHCGFRPEDVERTGAAFALLGHYHGAKISPAAARASMAYPGSPEALDFSEAGQHFVLLLDVPTVGAPPGPTRETSQRERLYGVTAELIPFGRVRYEMRRLDVSAAATSDDVRASIAALGDREAMVRIVLEGMLQAEVELDVRSLYNACAERFRYLDLVDRTRPAYDFEELAQESTTKGAFVRRMTSRIERATGAERETAELALRMGLEAFERREVTVP